MVDFELVRARPLESGCNLGSFSCGEKAIDDWVRTHAMVRHNRFRSRVVTFHEGDDPNPLGLFSMKMVLEQEKEVRTSMDIKAWVRNACFPALHLEYLGVCNKHRSQGLGSYMLLEVIERFCVIAEMTGVPALTLQPLNPALRDYYLARNFVDYGRNGGMLISSETAISLFR